MLRQNGSSRKFRKLTKSSVTRKSGSVTTSSGTRGSRLNRDLTRGLFPSTLRAPANSSSVTWEICLETSSGRPEVQEASPLGGGRTSITRLKLALRRSEEHT